MAVEVMRVPALVRGRWRDSLTVLGLSVWAYFAIRFTQVVLGPVVPLIIGEFDISRGVIGMALTGMWTAYAVVQLPSGMLADREGERRVIVAALGVTTVAAVGLAVAWSLWLFVVAVVVLGIGAGAYYNPATTLLTREFEAVGGAIGTHRVGGQVAGVVAPVVAVATSTVYGWRVTVGLGGVFAILAAVLFLVFHTPAVPARAGESGWAVVAPGDLRRLIGRSWLWTTAVMMALLEFVNLSLMAFLPTFLVEFSGYSLGRANVFFAGFFAVSALGQPAGGWLSDRIGRDLTIGLLASLGVAGCSGLVIGGGDWLVAVLVGCIGLAIGATPVLQTRLLDKLAMEDLGRGFGLFRTLYIVGGASGTAVVGSVADIAGWALAFTLLAGCLGGIILMQLGLRVRHWTTLS